MIGDGEYDDVADDMRVSNAQNNDNDIYVYGVDMFYKNDVLRDFDLENLKPEDNATLREQAHSTLCHIPLGTQTLQKTSIAYQTYI